MDPGAEVTQSEWRKALIDRRGKAAQLFSASETEQRRLGYFHTLREICQQPWTWLRTCEQMIGSRGPLRECMDGVRSLVFTGSGSSEYAGDCVRIPLRDQLGITTESIGGGSLLIHGAKALPKERPGLLVSLARSGNSPESAGVVKIVANAEPEYRHLVMTCNENGSLAKTWKDRPHVRVIALPPETNDESLVMTSSFTNLMLAARSLGMVERPEEYRELCRKLSQASRQLIADQFDKLARVAATDFQRVVFLGTGTRYSAAREAALKMLEMTSGRVTTVCETYLGLRHGPMSFVHDNTLIVCQLSREATVRPYELDLLAELDRKKLGLSKIIIGDAVPESVVRQGDEVVRCPDLGQLGDDDTTIAFVVVAQLLAFFRSLEEGLRPDSPSEGGVINRVVESFPLHTLS